MFGCHIGVLGPGVRAVPTEAFNDHLPTHVQGSRTWDRYGSAAYGDRRDGAALHVGEEAAGRDWVFLALRQHVDSLLLQMGRDGCYEKKPLD